MIGLGLGALALVPVGGSKPLVESVAGGQRTEPDARASAESPREMLQEAARVDALDLSGLPQDDALGRLPTDVAQEYAPARELYGGRTLDALESPFVGVWAQEAVRWSVRMVVRLELTDDGLYQTFATITPLEDDNETPAGEETSVETAGTWSLSADAIVLFRQSSTAPDLFPTAMSEAYWSSALRGEDWVYTDADGIERTLVRLVHTSGAAAPTGTPSATH